jgi:hypothetical protein
VMTKYRSEPKGRRNFDTALHYNTADVFATEKTRTAKAAVRAPRLSVMWTTSGLNHPPGTTWRHVRV